MSFRRSNLGFFCLEGFFWATYCTLFGYTVTILRHYGYSPQVCGLVTTGQCIVFMLVQPLYGYLVDHVITKKRAVVIMMTIGALFALPARWVFTLDSWAVVLYFILASFFIFSSGSIVDAWVVAVTNRTKGMDFALIRGGGSVFYATTALVVGNLITRFGVGLLFTLHLVLGLVAALVALLLVDDTTLEPPNGHPVAHQRVSFGQSAWVLLREPRYLLFTACMCLYNFATRPLGTFLPMVVEMVGGSSGHFGLSLFLGSGLEIVFMLLASRILFRGVPAQYLYLGAVAILAVRMLMMATTHSLWLLIATQLLTALGVGFNLRVNAEYLVSLAPEGHQGMAIMLSGAISNGVGCVLGNFLGGQLISLWGIRPYLLLCAVIMAAGALLFLPTALGEYRHRRQLRHEYLLHLHQAAQETERSESQL